MLTVNTSTTLAESGHCHSRVTFPFMQRSGLREATVARILREIVLPAFLLTYTPPKETPDVAKNGFRLVVDLPQPDSTLEVELFAGPGTPNFNPQDWRTPGATDWNPDSPAPFFEACAAAALRGETSSPRGNRILHVDRDRQVFAVTDGDPKAATHLLMLATAKFGTMADPSFTSDLWHRFFDGAEQALEQLGVANQPLRLVANFGRSFQQGPRVHMHVLSAPDGLVTYLPQSLGFSINPDGTVAAPAGDAALERIIQLIDQRKGVQGFNQFAMSTRQAIDQELFGAIRRLG